MMTLFRGMDEVVIRAIHPLHHRLEARHVAIQQLARRQLLFGRCLLDFLAVFVGAGEEVDVIAIEPHKARDGIRGDRLIGMANMRRAIRIGDRGRDVKRRLVRHWPVSFKDVDGRETPAMTSPGLGINRGRRGQAKESIGIGRTARRTRSMGPDRSRLPNCAAGVFKRG